MSLPTSARSAPGMDDYSALDAAPDQHYVVSTLSRRRPVLSDLYHVLPGASTQSMSEGL
jgi:hypothetical protein